MRSRNVGRRGLPARKACRAVSLSGALIVGVTALGGTATAERTSASRLADLSIEQLMNETVTSVSKKEQSQFDAPAAIAVLSNDDIRRSGATSIADALRWVPGMDVAAVNAREMAVSARGFNALYSNKLLVLVDGRAVYSPLFAGVFWDMQQIPLADVDRIEAIRGPGATIWGANAVNGVVNIVSRDARDTQGGLLYTLAGNVQKTLTAARYGDQLGEHTFYRVFGTYRRTDDYPLDTGGPAHDRWNAYSGGFRLDHHSDGDTHFTWQSDGTHVDVLNDGADGYDLNTLARWTRELTGRSSFEIQTYYDVTTRDEPNRAYGMMKTADIGAQHTFGLGAANDVIWGAGYRRITTEMRQTTALVTVIRPKVTQDLFSAFLQDEFRVVPQRLTVTAGMKLEHNDYTGFELQPSVRAAFKPSPQETLWSAISRAVRTPDQHEGKDLVTAIGGAPFVGPGGAVYVPTVIGNPHLDSEVLWAYELGYRVQPTPQLGIDIAAFYNDYKKLIVIAAPTALIPGVPFGIAVMPYANAVAGDTHGVEASLTTALTPDLHLTGAYTLLIAHLSGPPQVDFRQEERGAPRHQFVLRASYDFRARASIDTQVRYADAVLGAPAYTSVDLQLTYRPSDSLELALVGQNLLESQHPEQGGAPLSIGSEVPRSGYAKASWRF